MCEYKLNHWTDGMVPDRICENRLLYIWRAVVIQLVRPEPDSVKKKKGRRIDRLT